MPGIVVATLAAAFATLTATSVSAASVAFFSALVTGAIYYGANLALSHLFGPDTPDFGTSGSATRSTVRAALLRPRYVLGRARVGGYLAHYYEDDRDDSPVVRDVPADVHVALVLCAGPIDAIERIWVDGEELSWEAERNGMARAGFFLPLRQTFGLAHGRERFPSIFGLLPTALGNVINSLTIREGSAMDGDTITFPEEPFTTGEGDNQSRQLIMYPHLSGDGQGGAELRAVSSDWTEEHELNGLAWVHIHMHQPDYGNDFNARVWTAFPQIEFLVRGSKITWPGQAAAIWTDNAAAIRYWWERNIRGLPAIAFNQPSVLAAVSACGQPVEYDDIPEEYARYRTDASKYSTNGVFYLDDPRDRAKAELDFAWQGFAVEANGQVFFRPGVDRPPVGRISPANIIKPLSFRPQQALQDRVNAMSMRLAASNAHNWQALELPEYEDEPAQERDGQRLERDLGQRQYVADPLTAGRCMAILARRTRASAGFTYRIRPGDTFEALSWLPTDRLLLDDPELGFENFPVVIDGIRRRDDWSVDVTVREAPDGIHSDDLVLPPLLGRYLDLSRGSLAGQDGQDGNGVEYVFARTATPTIPVNQRPSNAWGYDRPGTVGGLTWTDGAQGTTAALPFEWRSVRTVPGTPEDGADLTGLAGDWSAPVILWRYAPPGVPGLDGVNGADGHDGAGVEYVFAVTASPTIPAGQRPSNTWGYDSPKSVGGLQWYDGAPNVSAAFPYLWRSERAVEGVPAVGDAVTDNWRMPTIVGRYGADGQRGIDGIEGADGADGNGVEYIFARTSTTSRPTLPSNSWGYDNPLGGTWTDGAPNLSSTFQFLWRCERRVPGGTAYNGFVADTWSSPIIVGYYGRDGVDGTSGPRVWTKISGSTSAVINPSGTMQATSWASYDTLVFVIESTNLSPHRWQFMALPSSAVGTGSDDTSDGFEPNYLDRISVYRNGANGIGFRRVGGGARMECFEIWGINDP